MYKLVGKFSLPFTFCTRGCYCIHWNLIINKHVACDPEIPSGDIVNSPIYLIKQLGERIGMLYVVQQMCLKANLKIPTSQQKHHNCASIFGDTNLFLT